MPLKEHAGPFSPGRGAAKKIVKERLQKILAQAGVASRRKAEEMILEGRVTINGRVAELGEKADPARDLIKVGRKIINRPEPKIYIAFNKPRGVITSTHDPEGRKTVLDYFKGVKFRVFPVGRLDYHSEGLLILTNDGALAASLTHPSSKVNKVYHVKIRGELKDSEIARLRRGIRLEDGMTGPAKVRRIRGAGGNAWIEISISEGRNRQVRRMFQAVGHLVQRLRRVQVGPLQLGSLKAGESRVITKEELAKLDLEAGMVSERRG